MESERCSRSAAARWAARSQTLAESGGVGAGYRLALSGTVVWCQDCGVYAETKAMGLAAPCLGTPNHTHDKGGAYGHLQMLRRGMHPHTGKQMPDAETLDDH